MSENAIGSIPSHPYFQVPLSMFAREATPLARVRAIIAYGIVVAGLSRYNAIGDHAAREFTKEQIERGRFTRSYKVHRDEHLIVACGVYVTGLILDEPQPVYDLYRLHEADHSLFQIQYGKEPMVRLRKDLVFEARDGGGITPEELAVLAGIYSIIGSNRKPVLITQDRIRCRALGYKSSEVMNRAWPDRRDNAQPLSDWKLRAGLDRLLARKLFVRATYGQRQSYYSHRMTDEQLRAAVVDLKLKRSARETAQWARHRQDEAMTAAIRECREKLDRKQLPSRPGPVEANG